MHQFPVGKGTTLGTLNVKDWIGPGGSVKVLTVSGRGPPPPISLNSVCRVTVTSWGAVPTFATEQTKLCRLFQYRGGVARSVGGFFPDPRSPGAFWSADAGIAVAIHPMATVAQAATQCARLWLAARAAE
ncbi:hypothetical protein [Variovorax guangxiensis]|uniref:hypothetical protein n=1 Tax=Variovorax guangxiensis TaxID=1775474 RepID=UPI002859CB1F|nr:hypothetical protein [Variovorax guangxiensis]MDR6859503.1 hypothetical protein [Variovorax guangxiensis]